MRALNILAATALVGVALATPAHAKSVDVVGTTSCTGGVVAKFKAGPRDVAQIQSEVQIDDVGKTRNLWTITVVDGGQTASATVRTGGASNSASAKFFTADNSGADTLTFTATRAGASCTGTVTVP